MLPSETHEFFGEADFPIPEDPMDPFTQNDCNMMEVSRSEFILDDKDQRQQINLLTSFVSSLLVLGILLACSIDSLN